MNKKNIKPIYKLTEKLHESTNLIFDMTNYIHSCQPQYYKNKMEKKEVLDSIEEAENVIIKNLWKMSQMCLKMIKKIDKEALRELQEESDDI